MTLFKMRCNPTLNYPTPIPFARKSSFYLTSCVRPFYPYQLPAAHYKPYCMRTSVKHIVPMLAQYLSLFQSDVTVEPNKQPRQVSGKRPAGHIRPFAVTAPNTARSIWQQEAYLR